MPQLRDNVQVHSGPFRALASARRRNNMQPAVLRRILVLERYQAHRAQPERPPPETCFTKRVEKCVFFCLNMQKTTHTRACFVAQATGACRTICARCLGTSGTERNLSDPHQRPVSRSAWKNVCFSALICKKPHAAEGAF